VPHPLLVIPVFPNPLNVLPLIPPHSIHLIYPPCGLRYKVFWSSHLSPFSPTHPFLSPPPSYFPPSSHLHLSSIYLPLSSFSQMPPQTSDNIPLPFRVHLLPAPSLSLSLPHHIFCENENKEQPAKIFLKLIADKAEWRQCKRMCRHICRGSRKMESSLSVAFSQSLGNILTLLTLSYSV